MSKTATDKKNSRTDARKQDHAEFLDFLLVIIVEPLLLAFAVLLLFSRLQAIMGLAEANPTYSFWLLLEADMAMNLGFYIGFGIVFFIWVALKGFKHRREVAQEKQLNNTLQEINKNLSDLQQAMEDLPDRIAKSLMASKNGDSKSK